MMRLFQSAICKQSAIFVLTLLLATVAGCETGLNEADTRVWLRHLIPLPKQVSIERTVQVAPADVVVRVRPDATDVELNAAKRLEERFKVKAQTLPAGPGKFEVVLGICDANGQVAGVPAKGAEKLSKLPNSDQAYVIAPDGENRLVLAALTGKGVFYAALTLEELLDGSPKGDKVTIPIARVLDWPDMEERGQWCVHTVDQMKWMAQRKMNLVEMSVDRGLRIAPDGQGHWESLPRSTDEGMNPAWMEAGKIHAVNVVAYIPHIGPLMGSAQFKLYSHFPELRGKRYSEEKHALEAALDVPCFAQPKIRQILADWFDDVAAFRGITDVCIWLTEGPEQLCGCDACKAAGHFAMETRTIVAAWQSVQSKHPGVRLRVLLTQGSEACGNEKVLAEIPPGIGVTDYNAGEGTYQVSRSPMIPPLLEKYAASGRWLGVYPTLEPNYDVPCPWTAPQFVKFRMNEFVDKKLRNVSTFAPGFITVRFALTAQAEWLWNARGRSPREFAAAYATREGIPDPEAFADWAMLIGDAGWDVYGYGMWFQGFFDEMSNLMRSRRAPELGKGKVCQGIFRYFPTPQKFADDLASCEKAMTLARKIASPEVLAETRMTTAMVRMLADVYEMSSIISRDRAPSESDRLQLQNALKRFSEAGQDVATAWKDYLAIQKRGPEAWIDIEDMIGKTTLEIAKWLVPFGVRDPYGPYWLRQAGQWETKEFARGKTIRKTWEITPLLAGPGQYQVKFSGSQMCSELVNISRVALASSPKGQPAALTEVSADEHAGTTWACRSEKELYTLRLPAFDANLSYYIVADIAAGGSVYGPQDPNPMSCVGNALIKKIRTAGEPIPDVSVLPSDPALRFYYNGPEFAPGKLRVGVITSCFGSDSILSRLQQCKGIDAQMIYFLPGHIRKCDVVVYPQPCCIVSLEQGAKWLSEFMHNGGGLIVTHDAVGFRGMPALAPEVCAKGVNNPSDVGWRVTEKHPLADGLDAGQVLSKAYYDLITLQAGPKGTVVAKGSPSGQPVVICGESGKGKYVACGLCLGLGAGEKSAPLTPDEGKLLENAVRWAASQRN